MPPLKNDFTYTFNCLNNRNLRRLRVLSISKNNEDWYEFRDIDMDLSRHSQIVRQKILMADVRTCKKVKINLKLCIKDYYNTEEKCIQFRGKKLLCSKDRFNLLREQALRKQAAVQKRLKAKKSKAELHKEALYKIIKSEKEFQEKKHKILNGILKEN